MKRHIVVITIILMFLAGCNIPISYNEHIKPIYPDISITIVPEEVDSLTPTFRWQSDGKEPCTYDFVIWDRFEIKSRVLEYSQNLEEAIYYKEALSQPEHTIEIPLAPNTIYYWSIRTRLGNKVSSWASWNYFQWRVFQGGHGYTPYAFRTPNADKKKGDGTDLKTGQVK
jgi:hypothetical protein